MRGLFATYQPQYAAHGIATFPVDQAHKRPMVRGYQKIGPRLSQTLAQRFPAADAFGFVVGEPSGITVIDIDTPDDRVLADVLDRHGQTPFVVRSGSGHWQAWYRHNGERRRAGKSRPWRDRPIDVLGAGYVVAPPSRGKRNPYEIVRGSLDDLDRLPVARNLEECRPDRIRLQLSEGAITPGARGDSVFRWCMQQVRYCDTLEDLLDVARTFNEDQCLPPISDARVIRAARSAWGYEQRGENRFGQPGAWLPTDAVKEMISDPYLATLIMWLIAQNGPDRTFWVADGLAEQFDWPRERFQRARRAAVRDGWIVPRTRPAPGAPIIYEWGPARWAASPTESRRLSSIDTFPSCPYGPRQTVRLMVRGRR